MFRRVTIALLAAALAVSAAAAKPQRVVSLYLCADELVLQLADRRNIASVTFLSRDPLNSNVADLAARVPVNRGLAEEVLAQRPDVALASAYDARPAVAMLKRAGIPVVNLGAPPRNLDEIRRDIRAVANAVDEPENGERMIAGIDARLAALPAPPRDRKLSAIVLNPNGFTIGAGSLVDEIFARAGIDNLAARVGVDNYGRLPLETILRSGADIAILNADRDGPPSLATEFLHHPALARLDERTRLVVLPARLWTCGGPAMVEAIERLSAIARDNRRAGTAP
jgi:iron complex transport system substrate-binding protein